MKILSTEKFEGETNTDFEKRVRDDVGRVLDVDIK